MKLRDRVSEFRGSPFRDSMSYASTMGSRVGLVYNARNDDWDSELGDDSAHRQEPEMPPISIVILPQPTNPKRTRSQYTYTEERER